MRLPEPGELFADRYEIRDRIGAGGFATVFDALEVALGRRVAVKILTPDPDGYDGATRARFVRETTIVGRLTCPHTVSMYHCGTSDDGLLYMAFEHVSGRDLVEILAEMGRLDQAIVVHLLEQLLESLHEAHSAGLLHRDIKPENVRVFAYQDDLYRVKLLDFGLARPTDDGHPSVTKTGELIGTPRYMSPEQLTEAKLSARSDIYSLGMVALEALVGRHALPGAGWADQYDRLLTGHVFTAPELDLMSPDLRQVIARMTARDPEQRYASARAVLTALDGLDLEAQSDVGTPTYQRSDGEYDEVALATTSVRPKGLTRRQLQSLVGMSVLTTVLLGVVVYRSDKPVPQPPTLRTVDPARDNRLEDPAPLAIKRDAGLAADVGLDAADDSHADADVTPTLTRGGCGRPAPFEGPGMLRERVFMDAAEWAAHIPVDYDPNHRHPVVIVLHQSAESGGLMVHYSGFGPLADRDRFLVIAPDQSDQFQPWFDTATVGAKVRGALEFAAEQLCVDRTRIYLVGQGSGGRAATTLACEPWVTALATNSFRTFLSEQICEGPRPYLMLSATEATMDPVEGGTGDCGTIEKRSLASMEKQWRAAARCRGKRKEVSNYKGSTCHTWSCRSAYQSCHLAGGQGWPGSPMRQFLARCDGSPPDFPTATTIWDFLRSQPPLPVEAEGSDEFH